MAGNASTSGRPPNTFVQSQLFMDRIASGEWASMGWANAYTSRFHSSWTNDLFGSLGAMRAPNIMTQLEFQATAGQSLNNRVERFMGGMISPWHTAMVQNLGQNIFENSQRFARFGDSQTGIMGSGVNLGTATGLARQVTSLSYSDSRMNADDYSQTVSVGMRMSQYDQIRSNDEFLKKTKELASAVGDLTRTLHLSVKEISESMGAMRQYGIVDVADQRRTLMRIGAAAQVGGLTTGQAMDAWSGGAQTGHAMGISAQVSGQVGVGNAALAREMSRNGVIPAYAVALGGGTEGIAKSITDMELSYASSVGGYNQLIGGDYSRYGGRRNATDDMIAGFSKSSGSPDDIFAQQFNKMQTLDALKDDPDKVHRLYRAHMEDQLQKMRPGIDPLSREARNMVYNLLPQSMNNAAKLAYANMDFTPVGRMGQESVGWKSVQAAELQQNKLDNDNWMTINSPQGQFNQGMKNVYSIPGRISDYLANDWRGNGVSGTFDSTSPGYQAARARALGVSVDTVRPEDLLNTYNSYQKDMTTIDFQSGGMYRAIGQVGGGLYGSKFGPVVQIGASMAGRGLGGMFDDTPVRISDTAVDPAATNYLKSLSEAKASDQVSSTQRDAVVAKLQNNDTFRSLVRNGNRNLKGLDSVNFAKDVSGLAARQGLSESDVYAGLAAQGVFVALEGANKGVNFSDDGRLHNWKDVIDDKLMRGVKVVNLPDFSQSDNAATLFDAIASDPEEFLPLPPGSGHRSYTRNPEYDVAMTKRRSAEATLITRMGGDSAARDAMTQIRENAFTSGVNLSGLQYKTVRKSKEMGEFGSAVSAAQPESNANLTEMRRLLKEQVGIGAQKERNRIFRTTMDVADEIVSRNRLTNPEAVAEFDKYRPSNNFMGMMNDTSPGSIALKDLLSQNSQMYNSMFQAKEIPITRLMTMNETDMSHYGIGSEQAKALSSEGKKLRENWGSARIEDEDRFRGGFNLMIANSLRGMKEVDQAKKTSDDQLFLEASRVIHGVADKLGLSSPTVTHKAN